MYATTHTTTHDRLHWILWALIVALSAAALLLATARTAAGQTAADHGQPQLVPTLAEPWQAMVDNFRARRFAEARADYERIALAGGEYGWTGEDDQGLAVWNILTAHARGDLETALAGWQASPTAPEVEVWRYAGIAAARLEAGETALAEAALDDAWALEPEHPVVHYFRGLLYRQQAESARDWPDAVGPRYGAIRLASYEAPRIAPNSRSMYLLAATQEFERAIAGAGWIDHETPLVHAAWTVAAQLRPTSGDLLLALGAERFEATAHLMAGQTYLDRGLPEQAEEHFDAARNGGVPVAFGYEDVAEAYRVDDRPLDAARAEGKSLLGGAAGPRTALRMLDGLAHAFRDVWLW